MELSAGLLRPVNTLDCCRWEMLQCLHVEQIYQLLSDSLTVKGAEKEFVMVRNWREV
jgi:hypothetical protein